MSEPDTAIVVDTDVIVQDSGIVLMPVMNIAAAKKRLKEFQEFIREYLVDGEDYGTIPGTNKPTLLKPGADKLCEIYGMADRYKIKEVENWQLDPPLFDYQVECTLVTRRDDRLVGTGVGSCNSWEGKYKYRDARRKCPLCGKEAIIKGKAEYGGGWLCFKKKDGCGAKFLDTDEAITSQASGKEINDDVPTLKNTILKMAKKRAKVDAVIGVTRSSGIFTQDMDDIGPTDDGQGTQAGAQRIAEKKIADYKAKKAAPTVNGNFVFILEWPEGQGGDVLVTAPADIIKKLVLNRKPSEAKEGEETHRLIKFESMAAFHDLCKERGVEVKDLTQGAK
jgi:hypothetical protein